MKDLGNRKLSYINVLMNISDLKHYILLNVFLNINQLLKMYLIQY